MRFFFAWAYEITPEGVKKEKDVDRSQSITGTTGRKLDFVIIAALIFAVAFLLWDRQSVPDAPTDADEQEFAALPPPVPEPVVEPGPVDRSIAVLPFVNMSSDQEQEWFSDGLTEEILNALARTPDLLVAARTSSFKFKSSAEDIPTIAKSLGVAHVLEGSVRRNRDQLRITAQLIRASDGFHLWSQTYDRNPEDIIAIQEEIAVEIATALETAMDPEALAEMMSSGTASVPAFNAYLEGMAFDASTLSTGDAYTFLGARDAFEKAVEIDAGFSAAYYRLAMFWVVQLAENNIVSGIIEIPREEMVRRFDEAIDMAIETERDEINILKYRVARALQNMQLNRALRINAEYLEHRPNDQEAQEDHLNLLTDHSMDADLLKSIREFQERDGFDIVVSQASMTFLLTSDDNDFIRSFVGVAMDRVGDSAFVQYQAHRALLWAGDVDGASRITRALRASDLPESSRVMVALRQACAENRLEDAARHYDRMLNEFPSTSTDYLSHMIMGNDVAAYETLAHLDEDEDMKRLGNYLSYAFFDAHRFPNLMALLDSQGIEPREPREVRYRCRT